MRIAVSGTHFSGKSSLVASLIKKLPGYTSVDEPYFLLEQEGYEFSEPPSLEAFEEMIKRSVDEINKNRKNTIFDRCPLDYLAYAQVITESSCLGEEVDVEYWVEQMEDAVQQLDLIVFVPIEYRDRIPVPASQDMKLRMRVDEKLQEMLLEDSLGILEDTKVLEVTGSLENRVEKIVFQVKEPRGI